MKFRVKENITHKYSTIMYLAKKKYISDMILELNKTKKINEKELAEKILKSLVPFHSPFSIFSAKYNIFFNSKGAFNDDILYGLSHSNKFLIYQYSRKFNRDLARLFLPKTISHWNYISNNKKTMLAKQDLRLFYEKLFFYISKKKKIDAWLSGNFGAFDEQEMAKAVKVCGGKFISFHKECMLSNGWRDFFFKAFKFGREKYQGHSVVVYNELTKKLIADSGLFDEKKIMILGMLRLDDLHYWRKRNLGKNLNNKKLGVFFTQPTAQFPSMIYKSGLKAFYDPKKNLQWTELVRYTNEAIYEVALENKDIKIVVKPKVSDLALAKNLYKKFGKLPKNLVIDSYYYNNASDLIKDSDLVCAFNSSSILETMAAGKKIISPKFAEALKPTYKNHLLDYGNAPIYAQSKDDLKRLIVKNLNNDNLKVNELGKEDRYILKYWTNNPNGNLGLKMPIMLEKLISS